MQLVDHASKSVRSTRTPRTQSGCLTTSGAIGQVIVLFRDRQPMYLDEIDEGADLIRVLARSNSPHQEVASDSLSMRELNPLGRQLIDRPGETSAACLGFRTEPRTRGERS